ncbi:hypothetical protein [Actinomyces gaoshouyii]|uniref:hypothetical protein n=1 Tax=Actinomyces gaoshouyii TaxID=1960083 RepID=UPI0009BE889C|nr:hypothetical protein [Actinomyces gaoshouyii]ARD42543.1 hypothetical protein B6G06_09460 [Actinomyces gaoshouyii]
MPRDNDSAILESAKVHHARLRIALLRGRSSTAVRRTAPPMIGSLVVAALISAGCVGYGYLSTHLDTIRNPSGTRGTPMREATPYTTPEPVQAPATPHAAPGAESDPGPSERVSDQ